MNIDQLQRAWKLASEKHDGQKYGGSVEGQQIEYLEHIGSVLLEVQNAIKNDKSIDVKRASLGAVFHDLLEDTDCERESIRLSYGRDILEIVEALTKNENLPSKKEMMEDSLSRIKNTYKEAAVVKMADRISNLYSPPFYWDKNRMIEYVSEARMIHEKLSEYNLYLGERLMTKIEKYEIEFIKDHTKDYINWEFVFTGTFNLTDMSVLLSLLRSKYGDKNINHKSRLLGDQITLSTKECKISIESDEDDGYRVEFETDNFLKNLDRRIFLSDLKKTLSQHSESIIFEYFFENKFELTNDYEI